jgi:uncharacterized membrane protein YphA (DoxX/SURF4 family)
MNLKKLSHLVFALTMVAIGIMGIASGGFGAIWGGVPKTLPDRQLLAYGCSFISLGCGAALLADRTAAPAAFVLSAFLIVWTILFKVPFIIKSPLVEVAYQSCGENLVLIAGAWILFGSLANERKNGGLAKLAGPTGRRTAYMIYGLALIAFGFSHFAYLNLTVPLVPGWLPQPLFWAYFTGSIYIATGFLIVTGLAIRLGAVISAVQIALITFLVWGPFVLKGPLSFESLGEPVVSWALTAAAFVVAESLRGRPWFHRFHGRTVQNGAAVEGAL